MRRLLSTLGLVVVLAALGGYIYFFMGEESPPGSGLEKVFPSAAADKVSEVTVRSESGDVTTIQKDGTAWKLTSPIATGAAEAEASGLVSGLAQAEIVRVIDPNPSNLGEYGLEKPRIQIEFKGAEGVSGRLSVGGTTPTGAALYARRNDEPQVFLIEATLDASLNRSTFDLRDKTFVTVPRDKVQTITVAGEGPPIVVAKQGEAWRLTAPVQARASYAVAEGLLGRLDTTMITSIATENAAPADLATYGLDRPIGTITVALADSEPLVVEFGSDAPNGVYARERANPRVVTVEKSVADSLKNGTDAWREKNIFAFRPFSTTRVEVAWSGKTMVLEKTAAEGDKPEAWKRTAPTAAELDKTKVDELLNNVSEMRATSFRPGTGETGLNAPALTFSVTFDDGKQEEKVSFGRVGDTVYTSRADDPGVATIDLEPFTRALATLDELAK
ncbi:MAG: DUF4340 domain-containing protein [Vicinamibacterales bacterium]